MNRKTQSLSVTSRNTNVSSPGEVVKEPVYINTAVAYKEKTQAASGHWCFSFNPTCSSLAACWLILLLIMVPRIYFTVAISENNSKLTAKNLNQTSHNEELQSQNQELQREKKILTEQTENIKTNQNQLIQWLIDAYCPKDNKGRTCVLCQKGWILFQSSCYAFNNAARPNQRNWAGARDDCRGKGSDLTAVADEKEKSYVISISDPYNYITGYWIGLRAVGGKWKWIDGSDLINQNWIQSPPNDGQCVISAKNKGWRSVSCADRNAWICEMKALTIQT